jgi:hypothetical protein
MGNGEQHRGDRARGVDQERDGSMDVDPGVLGRAEE